MAGRYATNADRVPVLAECTPPGLGRPRLPGGPGSGIPREFLASLVCVRPLHFVPDLRAAMRVPTTPLLALALSCSLPSGCRQDEESPTREQAEEPKESKPSFEQVRRAHARALQRAEQLAEPVLVSAHPRAAWAVGKGPLRPTPYTPMSLSPVMDEHRAAQREVEGIDGGYLEAPAAVQHMALEFALEKIAESAKGHTPTRTDPLVGLHEARAVLDAVDRLLATGSDEDSSGVLHALSEELTRYYGDLGGASAPSLDAALGDFEQLVGRIEALGRRAPQLRPAADALAQRCSDIRDQLLAQRRALPPEPNGSWSSWPPASRGRPTLVHLPPAIGAQPLKRRLEVEEGVDRNIVEAIPQLMKLAARIDQIQAQAHAKSEADSASKRSGRASPVTVTRCEQAVERIQTGLDSEKEPEIGCEQLVELWTGASLDEAALTAKILTDAYMDAASRELRAHSPTWLALQQGRTVAHSHRVFTAVTLAQRIDDPALVLQTTEAMQEAICLTTAAIWVHAELPDRDKLDTWLGSDCNTREPQAWIETVIARPRSSFDGLALTLASSGPAGAMMLASAPWAPLGLVPAHAHPRREQPDRMVEVHSLDEFLAQ